MSQLDLSRLSALPVQMKLQLMRTLGVATGFDEQETSQEAIARATAAATTTTTTTSTASTASEDKASPADAQPRPILFDTCPPVFGTPSTMHDALSTRDHLVVADAQRHLTPSALAFLRQHGFVVLDNWRSDSHSTASSTQPSSTSTSAAAAAPASPLDPMSLAGVAAVRDGALRLVREGRLQPAKMRSALNESWDQRTYRGDTVMWLHDDDACVCESTVLPRLLEFTRSIQHELNAVFPAFVARPSTASHAQLACYAGAGEGYVRHVDTQPMREEKPEDEQHQQQDLQQQDQRQPQRRPRRITCIVYPNPDWRPEHGGWLRVFVGSREAREDVGDSADDTYALPQFGIVRTPTYVDIAPIAQRVVLFASEHIEHEVRPSFAQRFAVTTWFS